jgi:hypothetical protein
MKCCNFHILVICKLNTFFYNEFVKKIGNKKSEYPNTPPEIAKFAKYPLKFSKYQILS